MEMDRGIKGRYHRLNREGSEGIGFVKVFRKN